MAYMQYINIAYARLKEQN